MLYLRTFGGLTLENGGPLSGAGAQRSRLALLAVLAAAGDRGISRDSLLAIFWPESDTEQARGALKQALYALRRDVGGPELIAGSGNLVLNATLIGSDVAEFNRALEQGELERAVLLYRGKFLEGVHLNGGEFDRWLEVHRQHLHALYQDALGRLARSAESRSEYPEALSWWRLLAVADPLSALIAGSLMRALAKAGDGAAALRHAKLYEQLVKQELGAAPDRSVLELAAQISRGGVAQAPGAQPEPDAPAKEPAPPNDADAVEVARVPVRRARKRVAAGLALAAAGVLTWAVAARRRPGLDSDTVVLTTGMGVTGSRLDSLLQAELASGLVERDRTLKLESADGAGGARARYVVQFRSVAEGDSVRFTANITDALGKTPLSPIVPVVVPVAASAIGARAMRDRVSIALAAHRNPLFANWAYAAELPYSWESFEQLALGIQAFAADELGDRSHLQMAATLDSTSAAPMLWEALVLERAVPGPSDSVLTAAERSTRRFGPWGRALAALIRAQNRHDLPAAHAAGHRLLEVVPGSEWGLFIAGAALGLGRAREAAELTDAVSRNPGWSRDWWLAAMMREQAYHMLGDYRGELAVVHEVLRRDPDSRLWLQQEVKALAGLGRVDEVTTACERATGLRPEPDKVEWWPCDQALIELAAHGHMAAARSLAQRLLPAREAAKNTVRDRALVRAELYESLAEWEEVGKALREVPAGETGEADYLGLLTEVQAFHGDRTGVEQSVRRLDSLNARTGSPYAGGYAFQLAGIAALLGDRDRAMDLLHQAFQEGFGRFPLHWAGPFDSLHGYPPFDALLHPVDDAAHLAQLRQDWTRGSPSTLSLRSNKDREAVPRRQ